MSDLIPDPAPLALPEAITGPRLVAAVPALALDDDSRSRLLVVLEILAQQSIRTISLHVANLEVMTELRTLLGRRLTFGVHGVLDGAQLETALAVDPAFVLADCADPQLVEVGRSRGTVVLPAALTPNEVLAASHLGASAVQVFPADVMGGAYAAVLTTIHPGVTLIPRGGLGVWSVGRWFEAGALACVLDDGLFADALQGGGSLGQLRDRCASYRDSVPKA